MHSEAWIQPELNALRQNHLKREIRSCPKAGGRFSLDGQPVLNFGSNDYLDLAHKPEIIEAAQKALTDYGTGAGASRLVSGSLPLHATLEQALAKHKGYPDALVFGSGFLANTGIIPALVGRRDTIFADKLVHASIIDAAKLSHARFIRFRHNDYRHLEKLLSRSRGTGRCLIVTESVFSMDGDLAPLPEIAELAAKYDAMLMVDEAHATGVFGPHGAGLVAAHRLEPKVNIAMGTFSKALGNYGGFATCSTDMKEWLVNRARSFIYTTAPAPPVAGGCLAALRFLERNPDLGEQLQSRANYFRELLKGYGFDTGRSRSQIIPVMVGDSERALQLAAGLRGKGILAVAIRPPTVPRGTARLRLSVTLAHSEADLQYAAEILATVAKRIPTGASETGQEGVTGAGAAGADDTVPHKPASSAGSPSGQASVEVHTSVCFPGNVATK